MIWARPQWRIAGAIMWPQNEETNFICGSYNNAQKIEVYQMLASQAIVWNQVHKFQTSMGYLAVILWCDQRCFLVYPISLLDWRQLYNHCWNWKWLTDTCRMLVHFVLFSKGERTMVANNQCLVSNSRYRIGSCRITTVTIDMYANYGERFKYWSALRQLTVILLVYIS